MLYVWNKSWDCWDLLATSRSVFFGKNVSCYCLQFLQNKYGGFKQFQKFQANLSNFILTRSDVLRKKLKIKKGLYERYLVTANQTNQKAKVYEIRHGLYTSLYQRKEHSYQWIWSPDIRVWDDLFLYSEKWRIQLLTTRILWARIFGVTSLIVTSLRVTSY